MVATRLPHASISRLDVPGKTAGINEGRLPQPVSQPSAEVPEIGQIVRQRQHAPDLIQGDGRPSGSSQPPAGVGGHSPQFHGRNYCPVSCLDLSQFCIKLDLLPIPRPDQATWVKACNPRRSRVERRIRATSISLREPVLVLLCIATRFVGPLLPERVMRRPLLLLGTAVRVVVQRNRISRTPRRAGEGIRVSVVGSRGSIKNHTTI